MSSSLSEMLRSSSCRDLSIPQLINIIKPSCEPLVLNEMVSILVNREEDMKVESDHLTRELHRARELINLLDSKLASNQADKCRELVEITVRLTKRVREFSDSEKKATAQCKKIAEELMHSEGKCRDLEDKIVRLNKQQKQAMDEKTAEIIELNYKLDEMNKKNVQSQAKCMELEELIERSSDKEKTVTGQCKKIVEDLMHNVALRKELEEKIQRLTEEQKKAIERYEDTAKILSDKNNLVFELNKKFNEVKDENLERQCKCMELGEMIQRLAEEKGVFIDRQKKAAGQCTETDEILREKTALIRNSNNKLEELKDKSKGLEHMIEMLTEEQKASNDGEKKSIQILDEKTNLVLRLSNSLEEMKSKDIDSQRLLQESQKKISQLDANVVKMKQQIADLQIEKSMLAQELKSKADGASQTESKLNLKVLESKSSLDDTEMRTKRMEGIRTTCFRANLGGFDRKGSNPCMMTPLSDTEVIQTYDNGDELKLVEAAKFCSTGRDSCVNDQMMTVKASPEDNASRGKRKFGDISAESKVNTDGGAPWIHETDPPKLDEAERGGVARIVRWKSIDDVMKFLREH